MSVGLAGSFLLVSLRSAQEQPPWYLACLAGPFMAGIAFLWWLAARRWWSVQHAMFMRMRHIERRLGLHSLSYVRYLDHPETLPVRDLARYEIDDLRQRSSAKHTIGIGRHQHWGVQATLWLLPIVILFAWLLYAFVLLVTQLAHSGW